MATKITVKNANVWVEVERGDDKGFTFSIGHIGSRSIFKCARYPKEWIPTIKDAKEMAQTWLDDYK